MAGILPEDRNYTFSSSLLNLKFMKKTGGIADKASSLPKKFAAGPALTNLEANRREMESRIQLRSSICVNKEYSSNKLYDLVVGRFAFKGINPTLEAALNGTGSDEMETGGDQTGKDISDADMADRYSTLNGTVGRKFGGGRNAKRKSGDDGEDFQEGDPNNPALNEGEPSDRRSSGKGQRGRYFTAYSSSDRGKQRKHYRGGGGNQKMQWGRKAN